MLIYCHSSRLIAETWRTEPRNNIAWGRRRRRSRDSFFLESLISFAPPILSLQALLLFSFFLLLLGHSQLKHCCCTGFSLLRSSSKEWQPRLKGSIRASSSFHKSLVKEREMEIGYPTDVKHVAHIGWDGPSGNAPSWMNDFKTPPDFTSTTLPNTRDSNSIANFSPWSSQDFDQSIGNQAMPMNSLSNMMPSSDPHNISKKSKRKKKSSSSPTFLTSSSRSSLGMNSKAAHHELDPTTNLQQV